MSVGQGKGSDAQSLLMEIIKYVLRPCGHESVAIGSLGGRSNAVTGGTICDHFSLSVPRAALIYSLRV